MNKLFNLMEHLEEETICIADNVKSKPILQKTPKLFLRMP